MELENIALLYSANPTSVRLAIGRASINQYLSLVWERISKRLGPVACQHLYAPSSNVQEKDVYIYAIEWPHASLPLHMRISFTNSLKKGLTNIAVRAVNTNSNLPDNETERLICSIAIEAQEEIRRQTAKRCAAVGEVIITSLWPLNGLYKFKEALIVPCGKYENHLESSVFRKMERAHYSKMVFPICCLSEAEIQSEALRQARVYASALTLITQNLFAAEERGAKIYLNADFQSAAKLYEQEFTCGKLAPDDGLFKKDPYKRSDGIIDIMDAKHDKEIIEAGDVLHEQTICMPKHYQQAVATIVGDYSLCASAKRFQESLMLHQEVIYDPHHFSLGFAIAPYQLIALVASIEALLDTSEEEIMQECPSCGQSIKIKARSINKKFQAFVAEYFGDNPQIKKAFADLYKDRSKFVHTGKDLYHPSLHRWHQPLFIEGKSFQQPTPHYYSNISDFTGLLLRRHVYQKSVLR